MQAIPGPWSALVREIIAFMDQYNLGRILEWSSSRGRDFQCVASVVYVMEKPDVSYPTSVTLDKWLHRVTAPTKNFKERILETFGVLKELVLTKKFKDAFQKPTRVSPIEFIMSVILIERHMRTLTYSQLATAITKMREHVRQVHIDIRANSKVAKTMSTFIDTVSTNFKKETGERPALAEFHSNPTTVGRDNGKRKRIDSSEESDLNADDKKQRKGTKSLVKKSSKTGNDASTPTGNSTTPAKLSKTKSTVDDLPQGSTASPVPPGKDRLAAMRAAKVTIVQSAKAPISLMLSA